MGLNTLTTKVRLRGISLAATLSVLASVVIAFAAPAPAQARCIGQGGKTTSTLVVSGTVYVTEIPVSGTCDGNNTYTADFRSEHSGWRASVWIQNNGQWTGYWGGFGTGLYRYSYHDSNSHSYIHFCLDDGSRFFCGWGTDWGYGGAVGHAFYGVNSDF